MASFGPRPAGPDAGPRRGARRFLARRATGLYHRPEHERRPRPGRVHATQRPGPPERFSITKPIQSTPAWQRALFAHLAGHPDRPLKTRALARALQVPDPDYTTFRAFVRDCLADGRLVLGPGRTLRLPDQAGLVVGTYRAHPRGFGFLQRLGKPDVYVARDRTTGVLDGDRVAARLTRGTRRDAPEAEIVRLVARSTRPLVGIVLRERGAWLVHPVGRDVRPPIRVDEAGRAGARAGELVVLAPDDALDDRAPHGRIVERLGDAADARTHIRAIIRRHELPDAFPPGARQAAERAAAAFDPTALDGRIDLRELLVITIDPPDARDFDDAISIESLAGGQTRLGVHIADVAHFVPTGGALDREARRRGTSVYFPGLVLPMLPEALSAGVCSLQPGQPRYARSVFITYDGHARVVETRFARTLIRSAARLTYEAASAALEGTAGDLPPPVLGLLREAATLARRIRQRRIRDGMISLALPEVRIELDNRGRVTAAGPADASFSHTLIEMFMVEANEAVSRRLTQAGLTHLRRIHPPPAPEEAEHLRALAPLLGRRPPTALDRATIQELLATTRGRPEEAAVHYILLRSLPQASYDPGRVGHFALASRDYCHFTSPIRRYPDLTVHRLLDSVTTGPAGRARRRADDEAADLELAALGHETSAAERRAQQAARDANAALLALFMKGRVGEVCAGLITGVTSFGVFVQLRPYLAEGLMRVGDFGPDEWRYDREHALFTGRRSGRQVFVGQPVRVLVAAVDEFRNEIVLLPADGGPIGVAGRSPRGVIRTRRGRGRRKSR